MSVTVPPSVLLYLVFLCLLACERGVELLVSRRNAREALAAGGVETGRGAYALMVVVHALFPVACAGEVLVLRRLFPGAIGAARIGDDEKQKLPLQVVLTRRSGESGAASRITRGS